MSRKSCQNKRFNLLEGLEDRRLFAAGAFDKSFALNGFNTANFGDGVTAIAEDVVVQPDGKTVVVGTTNYKSGGKDRHSFAVARFNVDGTLDKSFGGGDGVLRAWPTSRDDATASAVAIQPDGKIVVAGDDIWDELLGFDDREFIVMRFHPNGDIDKSFGSNGVTHAEFAGGAAEDMVLQQDGKIVVVGYEFDSAFTNDNMAIARFNSNGSLDRTFDLDGKKTINFGVDGPQANAVTIDYTGKSSTNPNFGKIVIAGSRFTDRNQPIFARLNTNGSLDKTFDGDGMAIRVLPGNRPMIAESVYVHPNGKIVFAGKGSIDANTSNFAMGRLNANGTTDFTFGPSGSGFVEANLGTKSVGSSVMANIDGSLFAAGSVNGKFAVAKFNANGILDKSFGANGMVVTNIGDAAFSGVRITQGPGRRFVLAGGKNFTTARFLDTGANIVTVGTFNPQLYEAGQRGSGFIVARPERLPYATRVYFRITGSASHPSPYKLSPDYTCDNMGFVDQFGGVTFVDIPAGQTFTTVALRPRDDFNPEGMETAKFTIQPDANYEPDANNSVTMYLNDDDSRTIRSVADGYVRDGANAGVNFGKTNQLQVKSGNAGSGNNQVTYVKFDLSSVVFIDKAYLKLFGWLNGASPNGVTVSVLGANSNWNESGLNFNNKPSNKTGVLGSATLYSTNGFDQYFDVTNFLRAEKAAGRNIVTFAIKANSPSNPTVSFASRETDNGPMLVVV